MGHGVRADARWLALLAKVFSNQCSVKKRRLVPPLLAAEAARSVERRAESGEICSLTLAGMGHGA